MAITWLQYRADVKAIIADVTPSDDLFALAVADFVKAMISREIDKDLTLYKSYWDSYQGLRLRMLGYVPTTLVLGSTLDAEVLILLTVDGDREGLAPYITRQIKNAYQDLITFAVKIDRMIRAAVIDLQSHIECYREGQETVYGVDDVTNLGVVSRGELPEQCEVKQVLLIEPVPALTADTFYRYGDRVSSNGRTYQVLRAGTTPSDISAGLTTTNGSLEILGSAGFVFYSGSTCVKTPFIVVPWAERTHLDYLASQCGKVRRAPMISLDTESKTFFAWPALTGDIEYSVLWNGLRLEFSDGDFVPLDEYSKNAVKEWVRAELALSIGGDRLLSEQHRGRYEQARSRLFADCSQRKKIRYN